MFKVSNSLIFDLRTPRYVCYARLGGRLCSEKSVIKWHTSAHFLMSLLRAIQDEYVKQTFLVFLRKSGVVPDDRVVYLVIRFRDPLVSEIDYNWNYRICTLCSRFLHLEKMLWVLSTFGGALSAMGDYYKHFAERAERVSYNQMRLALDIGDPVLVSRCKLYISISFMQRNKCRTAAKIIRKEYGVAKALKSDFLLHCCEGVWLKLRGIVEKKKCCK
ncbi:unnamed protein product [Thelazia callipaeda]|uniref:Zf-RVT domain-containing protein n=1 Tax=Thelazia callipaeda TaxID=103827 RepID=A0A0N5D167_THECL|nr:unnamed protein product [Thelazia callipaeda]